MNEQVPQSQSAPLPPLSAAEEKQWALISHLSVLVNIFTVFMSAAVPLIIYLIYKDRSRYVAYHAMQAFVMQIICSFAGTLFALLIGGVGGMIPGINLLCLPVSCLFALLPVVGFIYGIYGGVQINNGQDFKYWMIGDWVHSKLAA